jgi:O-antigen ligase
MWAAGLAAFKASPVFGLGFGEEYKSFLQYRVDTGLSHPSIFDHRHLHNEFITTASRLGFLGVFSYLLLVMGSIGWFLYDRRSRGTEAKVTASLGLTVAVAMVIFPSTDSMFGTTLHPMLYAILIGVSAGALRHQELISMTIDGYQASVSV